MGSHSSTNNLQLQQPTNRPKNVLNMAKMFALLVSFIGCAVAAPQLLGTQLGGGFGGNTGVGFGTQPGIGGAFGGQQFGGGFVGQPGIGGSFVGQPGIGGAFGGQQFGGGLVGQPGIGGSFVGQPAVGGGLIGGTNTGPATGTGTGIANGGPSSFNSAVGLGAAVQSPLGSNSFSNGQANTFGGK